MSSFLRLSKTFQSVSAVHVLFSLEDGSLRNYQAGVVQLLHFHYVCASTAMDGK